MIQFITTITRTHYILLLNEINLLLEVTYNYLICILKNLIMCPGNITFMRYICPNIGQGLS